MTVCINAPGPEPRSLAGSGPDDEAGGETDLKPVLRPEIRPELTPRSRS
ncbi:hypothetical protein ACFFX0_11240 [Citricoccus parietis]|uniref:Uncharacterized protein n=1 Tax=Citricoccus parietis TaxID=592307 RepID=A0ABV5FYH7_9MICC